MKTSVASCDCARGYIEAGPVDNAGSQAFRRAFAGDDVFDISQPRGPLSLRVMTALKASHASSVASRNGSEWQTHVACGLKALSRADQARMSRRERCFAHAVSDESLALFASGITRAPVSGAAATSPLALQVQADQALEPLRLLLIDAARPLPFDANSRVISYNDTWAEIFSGWTRAVAESVEVWPLPAFTELAPGVMPGLLDLMPLMNEASVAGRELLTRAQGRRQFHGLCTHSDLDPVLQNALRPATQRLESALRLDVARCEQLAPQIAPREQLLQDYFMQGLAL